MLVCHLSDGSLSGDYFRNIVEGLGAAGIEVLLVDIGSRPAPAWLLGHDHAEYATLGTSGKASYLSAAFRLAGLLRSRKVDILHTHLYYPGLIGALTKKIFRRVVFVLMRHHTSVVRMLGSRLHTGADKWMAERADHVLTVSEAARRYMRDVDGIESDIEVIYIGLDFERWAPDPEGRSRVRSEFNFADDDLVIGYVGNLLPGKGHLELVRAFREVHRELPSAKLFFIGRGTLADVESAAADLPVTFASWREDTGACYSAMDVFVQPSLSEAFSQVLIEAMGIGLPVIATNVGGAAEVIDDGDTGLLVEPGDVHQLANAIQRASVDVDLRQRIALAGRESVMKRFPAARMVERHIDLYREWVAAKN